MFIRAALYIDGFNHYHPINDAGLNYLKWMNLWRLGEVLCIRKSDTLVKVEFCTALPTYDHDKLSRHKTFIRAQEAYGVTIRHGHYVPDDGGYSEKQTDINLALSVITDGLADLYDKAFLLTADSDHVATARVFSELLAPKGKELIGVAPLNKKIPMGYSTYGVKGFALSRYQHEQCLMPEAIPHDGKTIYRPEKYEPPSDWVHPDNRPKGKPAKTATKWISAARSRP